MNTDEDIRVLHVDDDEAFSDMSATFLEREHDRISVQTATGPTDGLRQLASQDVDCIVSDYDMPGTNGIEFLDAVREEYSDLPFILFTGKGSEEVASDAISAGVTDYLQKKPGSSQYTVLANRIGNAVDQYRSRHAVQETERKLSELAEQTDDILFMFDADWSELLFINSAYEEAWGGSIDELEADPTSFLELIHPEDLDAARASVEQLIDGEPSQLEYRVVRQDGEHRWVRGDTKPIRDEDGNTVRIVGQVRDITDLKERELHLETIIGNLPGYVYRHEYSSEYPLKLVKGDAETVTGYTATELADEIGQAEEIIHPADREDLWAGHIEGLETRGRFDSTYRIITKEGDVRWIRDQGQLIEDPVTGEELIDGFITDVSDRVQRERELEQSNVLLSTLFETLPVGILAEDQDRNVVAVNERMIELFGMTGSPAGIVGADCEEMAHEISEMVVDSEGFVARIDELVSDRISTDGEELSLRDGRVLERSHRPIELSSGEGNLWVYRDVTDREQYEQTISALHDTAEDILRAKTEEEVAEVLVKATDELLGMPLNGVALHAGSDNVLRLAGVTDQAKEVLGSLPEFHPGESIAWEVFESGETIQYDDVSSVPGRHNPDTPMRSEIIAPLGTHGVIIIGSTEVGSFDETDVSLVETLASHAETALDRLDREQELDVKNQQLDAILDNTTTVLFMKDADGEYIFVNRKYRELFGLQDETIVGQTDHDLHPPAVAEMVRENDRTVIETGEPLETEERIPVDGEDRIFLTSKVPIYDTGERSDPEEPVAVFGIASDITELRRRKEQLQRERDRLDEFASVVSHDIRNPLSIAQGNLELVREESNSEYLDDIESALRRIDELTEDVLTLARGGDSVNETEVVDLTELAERCWRNVDTADATLRTASDRSIRADRSRLAQLLENLIGNAVAHGGDEVTVTVGELRDGFYVEDDGAGIPEADSDEMFGPGYSTTENGTGFGLSIVTQIVEAHGWTITAGESAEGGARFEIRGVDMTGNNVT